MPPRSLWFQDRFQRSDRSGTSPDRSARTGTLGRSCLVRSLTFRTVYAPMRIHERPRSAIGTRRPFRSRDLHFRHPIGFPETGHRGLAKRFEPSGREASARLPQSTVIRRDQLKAIFIVNRLFRGLGGWRRDRSGESTCQLFEAGADSLLAGRCLGHDFCSDGTLRLMRRIAQR